MGRDSAIAARTAALVLAGLAAPTAPALAADPPPPPLPGGPAVYQYRESLPTSVGPVAPGPGTERARPLPPAVAAVLQREGGSDAPVLEEVATSSAYGAPQRPAPARPAGPGLGDADEPSFSAAAARAVTSGADVRLLGLAAALLVIAGAGLLDARRAPAT